MLIGKVASLVNLPVILVYWVGDGSQMDDGICASESLDCSIVIVGDIGSSHLGIGCTIIFLVCSVDLKGTIGREGWSVLRASFNRRQNRLAYALGRHIASLRLYRRFLVHL